jgi:hypothetical protein
MYIAPRFRRRCGRVHPRPLSGIRARNLLSNNVRTSAIPHNHLLKQTLCSRLAGWENGVKMMTKMKRVLAAAVIGIATLGALSQASAQSVPHRHSSRQGHIERSYPFNQDDSQYPDYSSTGSGYSRGGCSGSPAEC